MSIQLLKACVAMTEALRLHIHLLVAAVHWPLLLCWSTFWQASRDVYIKAGVRHCQRVHEQCSSRRSSSSSTFSGTL